MKIEFDEKKLIRVLIWVVVGIIGFNLFDAMIGGPFWQIARIFSLTEESNFTTWFSSLLLLIVSICCYQISQSFENQKIKNAWAWMSLGFIFLSIEETAVIHENISRCLEKSYSVQGVNFDWIFYLALSPIIVILSIKYFRSLPWGEKSFWFFGLGVGLFVLGGGVVDALIYVVPKDIKIISFLEPFIEESLEMFGSIVMIKGLIELKTRKMS